MQLNRVSRWNDINNDLCGIDVAMRHDKVGYVTLILLGSDRFLGAAVWYPSRLKFKKMKPQLVSNWYPACISNTYTPEFFKLDFKLDYRNTIL